MPTFNLDAELTPQLEHLRSGCVGGTGGSELWQRYFPAAGPNSPPWARPSASCRRSPNSPRSSATISRSPPGILSSSAKRHVGSFFDVTGDECTAMPALPDSARLGLDATFHPDGYNVGINDGEAAGQGMPAAAGVPGLAPGGGVQGAGAGVAGADRREHGPRQRNWLTSVNQR